MKLKIQMPGKYKILFALAACLLALSGYMYRIQLWEMILEYYHILSDREQINAFITSFGSGAPAVFIFFQILQVLFAPFPGEATGFIGGYLFGTSMGFIYSSIGLTAGSWLNFTIGRFFGARYIRKMIPAARLARFDSIVKPKGIVALFVLFIFPGFPKDYLCIFLGFSAVPMRLFLILASIGRMPGTFVLSFQGASLYNRNYEALAIVTCALLLIAWYGYRFREDLYQWIERFNKY